MDVMRVVAGLILVVFVVLPIMFALVGAVMHLTRRWREGRKGTEPK